eukprot:TRINITY_DN57818_c0_g1_i1.p1 TRINITY_DN57818_c0_g1~~TRINITY_DN57818_c0_g1_i1.p1  ORF type:complete len:248 (-),score=33.53 TRINITY_DN57818_c0_g1_i1:193-936(-)
MASIKLRAIIQIFLTVMALATSATAVFFAYFFGNAIDQMSENFRANEQKSTNLPCIRSTLDDCMGHLVDKCWSHCCPPGYFCSRSPIVGLYCQDGSSTCGNHNWCRDFADIPRTCVTETCKDAKMVERVSFWSYILACGGILLDMVDVIVILRQPDQIIFKSGVNIFSMLMKLLAFGVVLGAGTQKFISDLAEARCYNADGMSLVSRAQGFYISYATVQIMSAGTSFILAPMSAYYGGKLTGVPYAK